MVNTKQCCPKGVQNTQVNRCVERGEVGPRHQPSCRAAALFQAYPPHERLCARLGKQVRGLLPKTRGLRSGPEGGKGVERG